MIDIGIFEDDLLAVHKTDQAANGDIVVARIDNEVTVKRFEYQKGSSRIKLIAENPLFGVGPGNWRIKIWEYDLYKGTLGKMFAQRPHNDFLWVFSEGGIVAGISYILLLLILIKDAYYLHKRIKTNEKTKHAKMNRE